MDLSTLVGDAESLVSSGSSAVSTASGELQNAKIYAWATLGLLAYIAIQVTRKR